MSRDAQRLSDYLGHIVQAIERDLPALKRQVQVLVQELAGDKAE